MRIIFTVTDIFLCYTDVTAINELTTANKKLVKVVDLMGREIAIKKNTVLIYIYDNGTTQRVFDFE